MKDKMNDTEYLNIMTYGKPTGTINVRPHPEDIIDVDPFVIAIMKARLNNENLDKVYDLTDRGFDELTLMREKNKLKKVFGSLNQLKDAFTSIKSLKLVQEEMNFEEVNRELLFRFSLSVSNEKNVDEYDFYRFFLFDKDITLKSERSKEANIQDPFTILVADYEATHFKPLNISREAIQMCPNLQSLFKERTLATNFDELLASFYGIIL